MRKEITVTMEIENDALNENNGTTAKIDVLLVEPGQYPRMVTIDSGLESLQKAVGGDIQAVYWFDDPVALICDEEGKLKGSRPNRALYDEDGELADIVVGKFLITGLGDEDFTSLPKEMQTKYEKMFHVPQQFFRIAGQIVVLPTEPDRKPKEKEKQTPGVMI
jgi:hypothetical protein